MVISFSEIMLNIKLGHYKYIGSGSCRKVFDLRNGYVIKVAKNSAGIAQNKSEYKISTEDKSNLFAKVIQVSEDYALLIMQKADKISSISYVWRYFNVTSKKQLFKLKELQNIKKNYELILDDFSRKSNWGMINGKCVIIDYGYTKDVMKRYY